MIKSLNTAASGMQAQQANMDVTANNLANVSTTGFKKARAEFEDLLYQVVKEPGARTGESAITPTGVMTGLGVRTSAIQQDFSMGAPKQTDGPLDMMIEGPGFFPVQTPDQQIAYTRNGSFKKDPSGRLSDSNGNPLQPEIVIPPDSTSISISQTGEVSVTSGVTSVPQSIGQIELVNFINPAGLKPIGKNLFVPTTASGLPAQGTPGTSGLGYLAQGQLELSNVNIVNEMVNMISAQRAYETNSKVIQAADQMLGHVNSLR